MCLDEVVLHCIALDIYGYGDTLGGIVVRWIWVWRCVLVGIG